MSTVDRSSLYVAYTDISCDDSTRIIRRYLLSQEKQLDTYRYRSPFPVYLSILKSHGPQCYRHYPTSSCAMNSISTRTSTYRSLCVYWPIVVSIIIGICLLVLTVVYKYFSSIHRQHCHQTFEHDTMPTNNEPLSANIDHHTLDEYIEKRICSWFTRQFNDEYRYLTETCRQMLNRQLFIQAHVSRLFQSDASTSKYVVGLIISMTVKCRRRTNETMHELCIVVFSSV
jgi:hypothetical protein